MSASEIKCPSKVVENSENDKKKEEKEPVLQETLKTTTERSTLFFLFTFDAKDASYEERLPKNFQDLECLLKKILTSLEETENVFMNQAKAVIDRDLTIITWRLRLRNLDKLLTDTKQDFERMDQTVQCILKLSTHIDDILLKLEKELPGSNLMDNAFKYTPDRMCMHETMMKININQKDMLEQISSAVLTFNETIDINSEDPVDQLTRTLNLHMEVLKTIERRMRSAEEQLRMVQTLHEFYITRKPPIMCPCFYC